MCFQLTVDRNNCGCDNNDQQDRKNRLQAIGAKPTGLQQHYCFDHIV